MRRRAYRGGAVVQAQKTRNCAPAQPNSNAHPTVGRQKGARFGCGVAQIADSTPFVEKQAGWLNTATGKSRRQRREGSSCTSIS